MRRTEVGEHQIMLLEEWNAHIVTQLANDDCVL